MITAEDVKDLQAGDIVELTHEDWPNTKIIGPLSKYDFSPNLNLAGYAIKAYGAYNSNFFDRASVKLIEKYKPPFYTNADRDPAPGDVADYDGEIYHRIGTFWVNRNGNTKGIMIEERMTGPWLLMYDGITHKTP